MNVKETPEALFLTTDLPGMRPEDVEVEFENNVLTIRGEKNEESNSDADGGRFHIRERRFGAFRRTFTLPPSVDAKRIEATFEHGVLTVVLPKSAEAMSRKIEVNGTST